MQNDRKERIDSARKNLSKVAKEKFKGKPMNAIDTAIHVLQDRRLVIGLEMKSIDDKKDCDKRKLNKEFERVDLSELDDDALSSLVQQEDDDLIFTIAENVIRDPEAHKYDRYDETTIRGLPAPHYATFDEIQDIRESIQESVKKAVVGYYDWLDDHRDNTWG